MTAVGLLVLGAIHRRGRAHGYQVRTDLESWARPRVGGREARLHLSRAEGDGRTRPAARARKVERGRRAAAHRVRADGQGSRGVPRAAPSCPCGQRRAPGSAGGGRRADRRLATGGSSSNSFVGAPTPWMRGTRLWPSTYRVARISRSGDPLARSSACGSIPLRAAPSGLAS